MLPRDTWQGYQLNAPDGPQPQRFYKKTVHPTVYTRLENPWKDLHSGVVSDQASLEKWEAKIPQYGCRCRKDYEVYKASTPPDFSSPEALWLWGFNLHNWVNRKLGKPELTVEQARLQWSRNDGMEYQQGWQKRRRNNGRDEPQPRLGTVGTTSIRRPPR